MIFKVNDQQHLQKTFSTDIYPIGQTGRERERKKKKIQTVSNNFCLIIRNLSNWVKDLIRMCLYFLRRVKHDKTLALTSSLLAIALYVSFTSTQSLIDLLQRLWMTCYCTEAKVLQSQYQGNIKASDHWSVELIMQISEICEIRHNWYFKDIHFRNASPERAVYENTEKKRKTLIPFQQHGFERKLATVSC